MMTPTAQIWMFFFIHIGVIIVVSAYYTLSAAIAPQMTLRARVRFMRHPWLPALIGLGLSIPWVVASIVLLRVNLGPIKFAGAVLGSLWILSGLVGGAGIAQRVGMASSNEPVSWIHSVRGGLFITLTWILPFIGWLIMLPLTLATGLGCLILGLFPLRAVPSAATAPIPSTQGEIQPAST